jgi:hypothetical protein
MICIKMIFQPATSDANHRTYSRFFFPSNKISFFILGYLDLTCVNFFLASDVRKIFATLDGFRPI